VNTEKAFIKVNPESDICKKGQKKKEEGRRIEKVDCYDGRLGG